MALVACAAGDGRAEAKSFRHSVTIDSIAYRTMARLPLRRIATICREREHPQCPRSDISVAVAGPHGTVYLAEPGVALRQFDEHGAYVRIIGNLGTDSAQYQGAEAASYDGGAHIHVFDASTLRLLTYDTTGRHLGTMRLALTPDYVGVRGSPDGLVVLSVRPGKRYEERVEGRLDVADAASGSLRRVGIVDARALWIEGKDLQPMRPFFLPRPVWAAGRDRSVTYAAGDDKYIARYDSAGHRELLVRFAFPPVAVSPDEMEREKKRVSAMFTGSWRERAQPYIERAAASSPHDHPLFTYLAVLDDGSCWIRESPVPRADSVRWDVLDHDGTPLGFVMPRKESQVAGGSMEQLLMVEAPDGRLPYVAWYSVSEHQTPNALRRVSTTRR
jgi:hypothetical protein